jgi:tetratricopeptide (TPR) repeat protein
MRKFLSIPPAAADGFRFMANEINIHGDDNIVISEVVGSQITVNKFLGDSKDYQDKVTYLDDKKKLLSRTPEDEPEERGRLFKEIAELEDQLKELRQGVINLAKTFKALEEKPEIKVNNTRLEKAREHFIAGRFTQARTILEQEIEAINDEGKVLLGHKAEFEEKRAEFEKEVDWYAENVQPKLEYKAYEFLILAQTKALNYESDSRIAVTKQYFEESIKYFAFYENLHAYASFLFEHSETKQAIDFWLKALEHSRSNGQRQREGHCFGNLGTANWSLGDYNKAIELHQKHLAIAYEMGDHLGEGHGLGNLGLVYLYMGNYEAAIVFLEQSIIIKHEMGDRFGEGNSLGNLGAAYYSLGNYQKAIELHELSLEIKREVGNRRGEGNSLGNLGNVYNSIGDYPRAIDYFERQLAIVREIGDRIGEGQGLSNLGNVYFSSGDYQKTIELYLQSLEISRQTENKYGEGLTLSNLGIVYDKLGRLSKACESWRKALDVLVSLEGPHAEEVSGWLKAKCPE